MADSKPRDRAPRRAGERAEGDPPEPADTGEPDQKDPSDQAQRPRRVPGLHGYDPDQWPDATV